MLWWKKIVWYLRGRRLYTNTGFEAAALNFGTDDLNASLNGKIALITGANSGIGKVCAIELANRDCEVHMVCRNELKALEAKEQVIRVSNNQNVFVHILDLSNPEDVVKFAKEFSVQHKTLDILINNAGCMVKEKMLTKHGLESSFVVNSLSPFLITEILLKIMNRYPKGRVINVSSGGMLLSRLSADLNQDRKGGKFDGEMAYAQHKRQLVVMTELWAIDNPDLFFVSAHPGWADTPAVRSAMPNFYNRLRGKWRTPEQGADTIVWLAVAELALGSPSGSFFEDRKPVPKHIPWLDTECPQAELRTFVGKMGDLLQRYWT